MQLTTFLPRLLPLALGTLAFGQVAFAREAEPAFAGLYVGAEAGLQNVIAGADVAGTDVLAQESKPVISIIGGYRYAWESGFVLGVEASAGSGDLSLSQQFAGFDIRYDSDFQWSLGGVAGWVPGGSSGNTLLFAYVSETHREFDVNASQPGIAFQQRDQQGLLRYGVGVERALANGWSVRALAGSSRGGFDDRTRNIDPDHPIDVSVSLIRRF